VPAAILDSAAKGASVTRKFVCGTCGSSIDEAASAWDAVTSRVACPSCSGSGEIRLVEQSRHKTVPRRSAKGEGGPSIRPLWLLGQLLILIPAFVLWESAGQCGRDFARERSDTIRRFGRFLGQLSARAGVGEPRQGRLEFTTWTPQARADLVKDFQGLGEGLGLTERAAEEFRACFVDQMINALPGGPAERSRLGRELGKQIAAKAGATCGKALSDRVANSRTWVPDFHVIYVRGCIEATPDSLGGEADRAAIQDWCDCIAREAPSYFASPAAFLATDGTSQAELSRDELKRITALREKCTEHLLSNEP
jgi:DNA-directed RNA polymerase subunit RPC12/RpoP